MKQKNYYIIIIGLIIIGLTGFNFYQRIQEERMLEFEGYEISTIENRVNALYNEEKTDIAEDIPETEFEELEDVFSKLGEKDLRNQSSKLVTALHVDFLAAREMFEIQTGIEALFERNIIVQAASFDTVESLEHKLEAYNTKTVYYDRNKDLVTEATEQLTTIEEVTDYVNRLLDDEGHLREDVTQEELDEAFALLDTIKNTDIQSALAASLDGEILVVEDDEEDEDEIVEDEEESTIEDTQQASPGNTGGNTGGSNTGGSNTGGSNTGGSNTGGSNTGGSNTGGSNTGGSNTGGSNTGGSNTGGSNTGGDNTGGNTDDNPPAPEEPEVPEEPPAPEPAPEEPTPEPTPQEPEDPAEN